MYEIDLQAAIAFHISLSVYKFKWKRRFDAHENVYSHIYNLLGHLSTWRTSTPVDTNLESEFELCWFLCRHNCRVKNPACKMRRKNIQINTCILLEHLHNMPDILCICKLLPRETNKAVTTKNVHSTVVHTILQYLRPRYALRLSQTIGHLH